MIIYIVVGIIIFLTIGYFLLMFFFPEWVGISGEDTRKALEAHKEENPPEDRTDEKETNNKSQDL
jgi:hypothetical protein